MSDLPPPLNIDPIVPGNNSKAREEAIKRCQHHWEEWVKAVSELQEINMKEMNGGRSEGGYPMMGGMFEYNNWMQNGKPWSR